MRRKKDKGYTLISPTGAMFRMEKLFKTWYLMGRSPNSGVALPILNSTNKAKLFKYARTQFGIELL